MRIFVDRDEWRKSRGVPQSGDRYWSSMWDAWRVHYSAGLEPKTVEDMPPPAQLLQSLDLSPLKKWVEGKAKFYEIECGTATIQVVYLSGIKNVPDLARMYGWPIDSDEEPAKKPEPNPAEKALDEFIARRKAKRENHKAETDLANSLIDEQIEAGRAADLDRAMQKLAPHHHPISERLMPYRGPNV